MDIEAIDAGPTPPAHDPAVAEAGTAAFATAESVPARAQPLRRPTVRRTDPELRLMGFFLLAGPIMAAAGLRQLITGKTPRNGLLMQGRTTSVTRRSGLMVTIGIAIAFTVTLLLWNVLGLSPHGTLHIPVTLIVAILGSSLGFWPCMAFVYSFDMATRNKADELNRTTTKAQLELAATAIGARDGELIHEYFYGTPSPADNGEPVYRLEIYSIRPGTVADVIAAQIDAAATAGYARPPHEPQPLEGDLYGLTFPDDEMQRSGWRLAAAPPAQAPPLPTLTIEAFPPAFAFDDDLLPQIPPGHVGLCLTIG